MHHDFLLSRKAFSDILEKVVLEIFSGAGPQTPKCLSMKSIPIPFPSFSHLSNWTHSRYSFYFQDQNIASSIFVQCRLENGIILPILINHKKPFPTTQRALSDILEQGSIENFSGGKPPDPQISL